MAAAYQKASEAKRQLNAAQFNEQERARRCDGAGSVGRRQCLDLLCERFGYYHATVFLLDENGLEATVRGSLAPYTTREDIDALVLAVKELQARGS